MSTKTKKRSTDVDMTEGGIPRHLITFAIPLLIGNLFQIMYNMVDTWVVGRFVSDAAFSAVNCPLSILHYETVKALRIELMALFSSRDTCA